MGPQTFFPAWRSLFNPLARWRSGHTFLVKSLFDRESAFKEKIKL